MVVAVDELGGMLDRVAMDKRDEGNSVTVHEKYRDGKVILIEDSNPPYGLDSKELVGIVLSNPLRKTNIGHLDVVDRKEDVKEVTSVVKPPIVVERYGHLYECHCEGHTTGDTQSTEDVAEQADTMTHVVHEKLMNVKSTSTTNVQNA
jgi:hypothetical protein